MGPQIAGKVRYRHRQRRRVDANGYGENRGFNVPLPHSSGSPFVGFGENDGNR